MKTIILVFTLLAFSLISSATESTENRLLRIVRAELPSGWTATYDPEYAWLEISRNEAVLSVSPLPNDSFDESPKWSTVTYAFRLVEAVDPAEYLRLSVENAQKQKNATALYEDLISKNVSRKFDSFSPSTNEEKELVEEYEALKKSIHTLPDFYFDDISLRWALNSPNNPSISVSDDRIRLECTRVRDTAVSLLSRYEKD